MSEDYPSVPNEMYLERQEVYGNSEATDLWSDYPEYVRRLRHLHLDLKTFLGYLKDWDNDYRSVLGKDLMLGPHVGWKRYVFKEFVEIQLAGWLRDSVGVGISAVRIGGLYYAIPKDLNDLWTRLENLESPIKCSDLLEEYEGRYGI